MTFKPKLTRFDLSMIVISLVVGMGIFASPPVVARNTNNVYLYFGAWLIGGIVSLCGSLTFAEIGSRYPTTGGFYKVFSYCFNPPFAFMVNWLLILSNAMSVAAIALIGGDYICPIILPASMQNDLNVKIIAIATVLILYLINLLGIKSGARIQNLLTIFKILIILILCTAVFKSHITVPANEIINVSKRNCISGFGISLVAVFFTFGGYQQTINFGGDIIDAKTNIPKAIIQGVLAVLSLYLLINIVYYCVLGINGIQNNKALAATLAGIIFGPLGYKIISISIYLSVLAYVNVNIMSNPRIYYAMAEDRILSSRFKKMNSESQVLVFGLSVFVVAVIVVLFFVDSFQKIINYVMLFDTIGLSTAAVAIFILRKKTAYLNKTGIYAIKYYPVIPIIFILTYWFVSICIFIESPMAAAFGFCTLISGLIVYYISKQLQKPISKI